MKERKTKYNGKQSNQMKSCMMLNEWMNGKKRIKESELGNGISKLINLNLNFSGSEE